MYCNLWLIVFHGDFFPPLSKLKSEGKPQKQICQVVLDHFEKQYMKELGEAWSTVRLFCLFSLPHKRTAKNYIEFIQTGHCAFDYFTDKLRYQHGMIDEHCL
ncbi:LIM domain-binding protein 1 [Platysternon megacephalum]|uniref:LIM domain-binding protein 1 n=1 Tax=Platysternon megacephalum TaxID=55544 RepID=A0A4D9ECJ7_9SAUR|nr:LIM domain-binding protein 1 [Platysternon megacephalum]